MPALLNDAVWYVIGPACYAVAGGLVALYVILAVLLLTIAGTYSPRSWFFGRYGPFSRRLFTAGDDD